MNTRRKFLLASVLALQNSSFIYPSCQKCFSRIILLSKRSNCPKCGSTGEVESASYRYKLSVKVAESNKLFGITVFGSCLDAFFGLTARDLHRYIQDPNEISETLGSDATQNLLTKAVENCFVGQSFIFGVTNFGKQHEKGSDSSKFLEQSPYRKREVKALVASQIVLPDPAVAGFTVIDYFHQLLQLSDFRKLHDGSQAPNCHLLALEHSSSDLSSLCCPDTSSHFFESCSRDDFLRFWQSSLELTSIVSQQTDDDNFSALEQSKVIDTFHQNRKGISFAEAKVSSSCHECIQGPWSLVSYMDKKNTAPKLGQELGLQANQPSAVHKNHHEIGVTSSNLFPLKIQEALQPSNTKFFHSAEENKNSYSPHELMYHQHHDVNTPPSLERPVCCPPSSLRLEEIAGGSQDFDSENWDDLPFSESLNKFLAVIENEIAITQTDVSSRKSHLDNDIDKLHADHSDLSVIAQRPTGTLHTPPIAIRSPEATGKANSGKDYFLSNYEANLTPSVQKESQPVYTTEAISTDSIGRDISEYFLTNTSLLAPFPSSTGLETTATLRKSTRIPPDKAKILLKRNTSESDHCLNFKYFNGYGEKSLSETTEKLTTLWSTRCNDVSDLCNLQNKQYSKWPENQGDSFTICRKLTYSFEALCSSPNRSTNTLKQMPYGGHINNNLTLNHAASHEASYDASADLFDDSAEEMDVATEITKTSQDIVLQWEKSLAKNHLTESDFSLRPLSKNSRQSSQKLSLQNLRASTYPKTCPSPPHFQSDSENDFEDSQDFVPCSQSTPVAGFYQTRIHGMKGAFKKLPAFYSDLDVTYKKRISSEDEAQKATPNCPKHIKTPSLKSRSPITSGITQPEVFNNCPIAECLESDIDEWVPPTTKKAFLSDTFGLQVMGLRKRLAACTSDQKELPRKKPKYVKQRTDECLIKKELNIKNMLTAVVTKLETPNYNSTRSGWISKESVLGRGSCSEFKRCLSSSENWPPSVPEAESAWSPELFS